MKTMTSFLIGMLMLLTLDSWGINLKKNLEQDEAQNAELSQVEEQLGAIMEALRPANLLKLSWVGENGIIGPDAEPKLFVQGNVGYMSFGIKIEVDTDKYAKEVYEPLKTLLDKYAKCINDNLVIQASDKTFTTLLVKADKAVGALLFPDEELSEEDRKNESIVYLMPNNNVLLVKFGVNFFQGTKGLFMLQEPTKTGIKCHVYQTDGNSKFNEIVRNAVMLYLKAYGMTKLSVRAEDEDGLVLGNPQEIKLNNFNAQRVSGEPYYFMQTRTIYSESIPVFISSLIRFEGNEFDMTGYGKYWGGTIYSTEKLITGQIVIPKDDLENVRDITFDFIDDSARIRRINEYQNKLWEATVKKHIESLKAKGATAADIEEAEAELKKAEARFRKNWTKQFDECKPGNENFCFEYLLEQLEKYGVEF